MKNIRIFKIPNNIQMFRVCLKLPKKVVVSPEDSVAMVKLQSAGHWRTINTCPITQ